MPIGIISNTAALNAQTNLNKANADSQASIQRLSSGARIDRPATDVAGLAVGTILQTNVSTLQAGLTNAAQANSLLGVAAGALQNLSNILQRQKALASQATSGSLNDVARGFLNQEFQNLVQQVDQIATGTDFNGIKLLDNSLYAPTPVTTNATLNSVATSGVITFQKAMANADTITINGVLFTVKTTPTSDPRDVAIGGTPAAQADDLFTQINAVLNSIDPARAGDKQALAGFNFSHTTGGTSITITEKAASSVFNSAGANVVNVIGAIAAASSITVNGTDATAATVALSTGGVAGTFGDLPAGRFSPAASKVLVDGATTTAQGTVSDTLLKSLTPTTQGTTGADFSGISNNPDFLGTIQGFKAVYNQPGFADISVQIGNYTYQAKNVNTAPAAATKVRFADITSNTSTGGYFDLQFDTATNAGQTAITNQADADLFAKRIDKSLSGVTSYQLRKISSYNGAGSIYAAGSTTSIGNLSGTKVYMVNSTYSNLQVSNVSVQAGVQGISDAVIEITMGNGEVFKSGYDETGASASVLTTNTQLAATTNWGLKSTTNPNNLMIFSNGATILDMSNSANATAIQNALTQAFGIANGSAGISFQIGTTAKDTIQVQIKGAGSQQLYKDNTGTTITGVNVGTLANATVASNILDNAINALTAITASVGALQSRFNYASSNIQSSITNLDAARSTFLDTDVAAESTSYAQAQVRLQTSISVLAQANQLPQSLLKLIG